MNENNNVNLHSGYEIGEYKILSRFDSGIINYFDNDKMLWICKNMKTNENVIIRSICEQKFDQNKKEFYKLKQLKH